MQRFHRWCKSKIIRRKCEHWCALIDPHYSYSTLFIVIIRFLPPSTSHRQRCSTRDLDHRVLYRLLLGADNRWSGHRTVRAAVVCESPHPLSQLLTGRAGLRRRANEDKDRGPGRLTGRQALNERQTLVLDNFEVRDPNFADDVADLVGIEEAVEGEAHQLAIDPMEQVLKRGS